MSMSELGQSKQPRGLVADLIRQLTCAASTAGDRSLGAIGPVVWPPHPPRHCLQACLHGDPCQIQGLGCPWLRRAAAGQLDPTCLEAGRCPRGFHATGQPFRLNGDPGLLLAIEDTSVDRTEDRGGTSLPDQALGSLSEVLERVSQVLDENEGFADEVLRSYEQLNLIFDFTRQIASLTEVNQIEKALLGQLGRLLAAHTMLVVGPDGSYRNYDVSRRELVRGHGTAVLTEQLNAEIEALRQSRTTSVCSSPAASILLGPLVRLDDKIDMVLAIRAPDATEFTSGDMLMLESILAFGGQIISNNEIHERLRRMSLESTRALVAAIDKKDHYTSGHSERVGRLAQMTGRRLGVSVNDLRILEMSALLHDVGKIGVPEEILSKPGRLTREEYELIKSHPRMGYEILKPIASFGGVLDGVLYHHENPDGSGYPEGLSGEEIPLSARIIHVADVFDALTSTRSYRVAYSYEDACEIIRKEAGTKLDAEVAAAFLEVVETYRAEHPEQFAATFSAEREVTDAPA